MARPREFDSVEVERALLDVFWLRGYARTSIDDLTEATGLLRGSLYGAYGDKESMFVTAMNQYVAVMTPHLATQKTGLEALQRVLDTIVRLTARDPERRGCLFINAIPESRSLTQETQKILQDGINALQKVLRSYLVEARTEAGSDANLDSLVALVMAATVSIRVLGRAGHHRRFLQNISTGALEAVTCRLESH